MSIRIFGAILIIASCGGFGFLIAANQKRETKILQDLIASLEFMECEMIYRLTPLPELCRMTASGAKGIIKTIFMQLAEELENQVSPNAEACMSTVIKSIKDIPKLTKEALETFSGTLGCFDLEGQVKCIRNVRTEALHKLQKSRENQDTRLRSYQTLALCAGVAIVIIII